MESIKTLEQVTKFEDFNLYESFRTHMIYEEVTKESFTPTSIKNILIYFFANVMACNRELAVDFDEFLDWLDKNPDMLNDFIDWMTKSNKKDVVKSEEQPSEEAEKPQPFHD